MDGWAIALERPGVVEGTVGLCDGNEVSIHGYTRVEQRHSVADTDRQVPGAGEGYVQAVGEPKEPDITPEVGAHQRDHHNVLFAALERVDGVDLDPTRELK